MATLDEDQLAHLRAGDVGEPVRAERQATAERRGVPGGCRRFHPAKALICCRAWGHPGQHIAIADAGPPYRAGRPMTVAGVWPSDPAGVG